MPSMHWSSRVLAGGIAAACVMAAASSVSAATIAYYRFEEGDVGTRLFSDPPGGANFTVSPDSAGGDDPMRTFAEPVAPNTSPLYTDIVPVAVVPQTGAANTRAFFFDGNDDIYGAEAGGPLRTTFDDGDAFTIEAWVSVSTVDTFRTFIGRDDGANELGGALGLFYLQQRANNRFAAALFAGDGSLAEIESTFTFLTDTYYHLAVVGDGTTVSLYVDGVLQGTEDLPGGLWNSPANENWTIGRGWFDGPNDWSVGFIDEVRFSDVALSPAEFLNAAPIPEPALGGLAAAALLGLRRRR